MVARGNLNMMQSEAMLDEEDSSSDDAEELKSPGAKDEENPMQSAMAKVM